MKSEKLKNAWNPIKDYEKSLKGIEKLKWQISCLIDDIHVWISCKYYKLFK